MIQTIRAFTGFATIATIILTMAVKSQATQTIGWAALAAMAILIFTSRAIGWWLGGPDKGTRRVLAISTSMRHAGLSLLIAITCFNRIKCKGSHLGDTTGKIICRLTL